MEKHFPSQFLFTSKSNNDSELFPSTIGNKKFKLTLANSDMLLGKKKVLLIAVSLSILNHFETVHNSPIMHELPSLPCTTPFIIVIATSITILNGIPNGPSNGSDALAIVFGVLGAIVVMAAIAIAIGSGIAVFVLKKKGYSLSLKKHQMLRDEDEFEYPQQDQTPIYSVNQVAQN
ncbi:hypothetical protein HELRODRAFT_184566 [Helobdella robusta]|uniref:Uncharacterized protein n=1 Tax=Helobdella robusta TaxID=6412 RepID=T1FLH7_HELRO|nr:hypothetical protein HELRODRAFT_184566 [Helobdella robusta]ESO09730.1 hypothetical protein HELRODRAFT_184566 [Helobdella robusta]